VFCLAVKFCATRTPKCFTPLARTSANGGERQTQRRQGRKDRAASEQELLAHSRPQQGEKTGVGSDGNRNEQGTKERTDTVNWCRHREQFSSEQSLATSLYQRNAPIVFCKFCLHHFTGNKNSRRERCYSPRKTRFTNCGKSNTLLIFLGLEMTRQSHSRVKGAD